MTKGSTKDNDYSTPTKDNDYVTPTKEQSIYKNKYSTTSCTLENIF